MRISLLLLFLAAAFTPAIATAQSSSVTTSTTAGTPAPLRYQTTCFLTRSVELYQQPSQASARISTVQHRGEFTQLTLADDSHGNDQWLHVVEGYVQGKRQRLSGYVLNDRVATPTSASNAVHGCIVEPSFTALTDTTGKDSDNPSKVQPRQPLTRPKLSQVPSSPPDQTDEHSIGFTCWLNRSVNVYKQPKVAAKPVATIEVGEKEGDVSVSGSSAEFAVGVPRWLPIARVNRTVDGKSQVQLLSGYVLNDWQVIPKPPSNTIERCAVVSPFTGSGNPQRRRRP